MDTSLPRASVAKTSTNPDGSRCERWHTVPGQGTRAEAGLGTAGAGTGMLDCAHRCSANPADRPLGGEGPNWGRDRWGERENFGGFLYIILQDYGHRTRQLLKGPFRHLKCTPLNSESHCETVDPETPLADLGVGVHTSFHFLLNLKELLLEVRDLPPICADGGFLAP